MSDICKCTNDKCILKTKCLRSTVTPHKFWQAYSSFIRGKRGKCDYFINNDLDRK